MRGAGVVLLFGGLACSELPDSFPGSETFELDCPGVLPHGANVDVFLVIGHRGAPAIEPENTLPSMDAALRDGATSLEVDLSQTADGHVVLWHDWDPNTKVALGRQAGQEPGVGE